MKVWRGLVGVLCAVGCGEAVGQRAGADASDGDSDSSPGVDIDAAGSSDAGPTGEGLIYVFSRNYTQGKTLVLSSTVTAAFGDPETEGCTVVLAGSTCQVVDCVLRKPVASRPDAGNLSIEALGDTTVLTPEASGAYADLEVDRVLFSDGGTLSLLAAGGDIPAFDVTDLTAPYSIGFQQGVPTSAGPIKVTASNDYSLAWGGIEASDTVRIDLSAARDKSGVRRALTCRLPAGLGEVTIPSAALQLLPTGEISFESRVETSATVAAGDVVVTLVAGVVARLGGDATGDWAAGTVLLGP